MPPVAPPRSKEQQMKALESANKIRKARSYLKKDLKAGRESVFGHLMAPPEYIKNMKVFDLVLAAPKTGRIRANKICVMCRISPSKTIGGLSQRQRTELAGYFTFAGQINNREEI